MPRMPRVLIYAFMRLGTAGFTHSGFRAFWALRQACSLIDLAGSVDGCYAMFGPSTTAMQSATAVPVHGGLVSPTRHTSAPSLIHPLVHSRLHSLVRSTCASRMHAIRPQPHASVQSTRTCHTSDACAL